ncbi:hypothetical protein [Nostoc sp.]|uniref:hypothetical protein n=1 Tax=Nostoc sp. TaxID=1180 RepID=UPI002FF9B2C0
MDIPSLARRLATDAPMPDVEPVTSATRFENDCIRFEVLNTSSIVHVATAQKIALY